MRVTNEMAERVAASECACPCVVEPPTPCAHDLAAALLTARAEERGRLCDELVRRANGIAQRGRPLRLGPVGRANLLAEIAESLRDGAPAGPDWRAVAEALRRHCDTEFARTRMTAEEKALFDTLGEGGGRAEGKGGRDGA